MTSLIWVGVSVWRISLCCESALHSIPQQIKVVLQWMMMMVMVTKKKVARQWCGWCKEVQGKEGQWAWGHHEEPGQEWGVAVVMVVMMVGGDYEKH